MITDKEKFNKVYANLPLNVRREIVLVIEADGKDKPITWDVAYLEIRNNTKMGENILKKLTGLQLI